MNITPPQSPQPAPESFTSLPTTEFKTWARHLAVILDSARIDSVTSNDLTQCVFTHIKDHIHLLVHPCDDTRYSLEDMIARVCKETTAYALKNLETQEKIVQSIRELWLIVEKQPWSIPKYYHHFMPGFAGTERGGWHFPLSPYLPPPPPLSKLSLLLLVVDKGSSGGPCEPGSLCNPPKNSEEPHKCSGDRSVPLSGTFAEKRAGWINSCRFMALLQREIGIEAPHIFDFSFMYVLGTERTKPWSNHSPDSSLMGLEQIVDVSGQLLWDRRGQWFEGSGHESEVLVRRWKWWEEKLNSFVDDEEREVEGRESARRTMLMMKDIREKNEA